MSKYINNINNLNLKEVLSLAIVIVCGVGIILSSGSLSLEDDSTNKDGKRAAIIDVVSNSTTPDTQPFNQTNPSNDSSNKTSTESKSPPSNYTLNILPPDGLGSAAPVELNNGTSVQVTAIPEIGWEFDHWILDGADAGDSNPIIVAKDSEHDLKAVFTKIHYALTVVASGQGSVSKNPDLITYPYKSNVQLNATPATGWAFQGWSGDLEGNSSQTTLTIDDNKMVAATFTPIQCKLAVNASGLGSLDLNPGGETYSLGSSVEVMATPAEGWQFDHWVLDE
jgi:hypothetical protein